MGPKGWRRKKRDLNLILSSADVIGVSRLTSVLITVYHATQTLSRLRSTAVGGVALTESAQRDTPLDFLVI